MRPYNYITPRQKYIVGIIVMNLHDGFFYTARDELTRLINELDKE